MPVVGHLIVKNTRNMQSAFSTGAVWGHTVPSLRKFPNEEEAGSDFTLKKLLLNGGENLRRRDHIQCHTQGHVLALTT